jgi:methylated-DNA-[protein]-cysteine S-methyltransferase
LFFVLSLSKLLAGFFFVNIEKKEKKLYFCVYRICQYKTFDMQLCTRTYPSPIGSIEITGTATHLKSVQFREPDRRSVVRRQHQDEPIFVPVEACVRQLTEYFDGKRQQFDLPLDLDGTYFQKKVWRCVQRIPFGETLEYNELAAKLGNPKAIRAVATASSTNPYMIIIPSHRLVGGGSRIDDYVGGIARQKFLLELEYKIMR